MSVIIAIILNFLNKPFFRIGQPTLKFNFVSDILDGHIGDTLWSTKYVLSLIDCIPVIEVKLRLIDGFTISKPEKTRPGSIKHQFPFH